MTESQAVVKIFFPLEHIHKLIKLDLSATGNFQSSDCLFFRVALFLTTLIVREAKNAIIEKRQKTLPLSLHGVSKIEDYGLFAPPSATVNYLKNSDHSSQFLAFRRMDE
jgi:hypothetical protein